MMSNQAGSRCWCQRLAGLVSSLENVLIMLAEQSSFNVGSLSLNKPVDGTNWHSTASAVIARSACWRVHSGSDLCFYGANHSASSHGSDSSRTGEYRLVVRVLVV